MKPEFEKKKKHLKKFKCRAKRILGTKKNISAEQLSGKIKGEHYHC